MEWTTRRSNENRASDCWDDAGGRWSVVFLLLNLSGTMIPTGRNHIGFPAGSDT